MRTSPRAIQGLRSAGSRGQPARGRHWEEDSAGWPPPTEGPRAGSVPSSYSPRSMLHRTYEGQDCSIARTLEIVGERWTLLIMRDAFLGIRRFDDIQRDL